jgi:hypothetical protein
MHAERVTPTDTRNHSRRDQLWAFVSRSPLDQDGSDRTPVDRAIADPLAETTRQTLIQCTLYIGSFFVTCIADGVNIVGQVFFDAVEKHRTFYHFFWVSVIKILIPSTFIWNFWIFWRPRLIVLRKQTPDVSTMALLWRIIFHSKQQQQSAPARTRMLIPAQVPEVYAAPSPSSTTFVSTSFQDENNGDDFTPERDAANNNPREEENGDGIDIDA